MVLEEFLDAVYKGTINDDLGSRVLRVHAPIWSDLWLETSPCGYMALPGT